jgi:uncharacterized protein YgbK (DUF1537 family)
MLLGCIADDFTGASDLANTLAKNGMSTIQFVGIPTAGREVACDAGVVALKTRSIAPHDAVQQSLQALRWLQAQGCEQFLFKYCSTFDSTPEGNIGPVAEALSEALDAKAAVVCPVFPETGRTLYQGHLFVNDRLLNESGMERHSHHHHRRSHFRPNSSDIACTVRAKCAAYASRQECRLDRPSG